MSDYKLYLGNCLNELKKLDDNSVDSCVTDPPYGLSFMGKSWDYDVPQKEIWEEVYRVLKPGGHLLSFFGSRTYHRGVVSIEDAGFEIRDQIMWLYGSGFPKSHDISKAIDREAGVEREIVSTGKPVKRMIPGAEQNRKGWKKDDGREFVPVVTTPATDVSSQWEGWGTALKPAHEPIVMARKPPSEKTVASNVLKYGTGALNIDGCRVGFEGDDTTASGVRVGHGQGRDAANADGPAYGKKLGGVVASPHKLGRWPANVIHDGSDEVIEWFPESKDGVAIQRNRDGKIHNNIYGEYKKPPASDIGYGGAGSAARFFYCAKASKSDRDEGLEDFLAKKYVYFQTGNGASGSPSSISEGRNTEYKNIHPTVKPTDLMKYLCKLVTPKSGVVLDPFMGSGSTGKAAMLEGFDFIGIEMNNEYFEIAEARIKAASENKTCNLEEFFAD